MISALKNKLNKEQTIQSLTDWITNSDEDQIVYYKGYLAEKIGINVGLRKLASFMMDMHKLGKVALTQKKISGIKQIGDKGDIIYLYIAQRRKNAKQ